MGLKGWYVNWIECISDWTRMTTAVEDLLTPNELAQWLSVPKATLYAWRYRGEGPPSMRIGRHLRYRRADVDEWLTSRVQVSHAS